MNNEFDATFEEKYRIKKETIFVCNEKIVKACFIGRKFYFEIILNIPSDEEWYRCNLSGWNKEKRAQLEYA